MIEHVIDKTVFFAITNIDDMVVVVYSRGITSTTTDVYDVYLELSEYQKLMKGDLNEVLQKLQEASSRSVSTSKSTIRFVKYMPRGDTTTLVRPSYRREIKYEACTLFN